VTARASQVEDRLAVLLAPMAGQLGVKLLEPTLPAVSTYAARLLEWNERINLSGARDIETLAREHLADALVLVPHLPRSGRCIDVGSGAGLPGLVLAIARPDLSFQLLEPRQKRRAFLASVTRELEMTNVAISAERASSHAENLGEVYDFAVARAVFPLAEWLALGVRLVRPGGIVAGLAGAGGIASAALPSAEQHRYDVGAGPRVVVLVRK
jgi:16S rRNA (guanine527-N7)-methyltransferase